MGDPPLHVENFPPDLGYRLRVCAAIRKKTIRASVIEAVTDWVTRQERAQRQASAGANASAPGQATGEGNGR